MLDFELGMELQEVSEHGAIENRCGNDTVRKVAAVPNVLLAGLVLNADALNQYLRTISGTRIRSKIVWDLRTH